MTKKTIILTFLLISSISSFSQGDSALLFNGTSDYLEFSTVTSTPSITTEFSVECWVKFDSTNVIQPIIQYGNCFNSNHSFNIQLNGENKLGASINDDNSCTNSFIVSTDDTLDPSAGCYHTVAVFKAPNEFHFYVNGTEMSSTNNNYTVTSVSPSAEKIRIGSYVKNNGQMGWLLKGEMNHFGLFNKALTATQVSDHYVNGISSTTSDLEIYYPLNSQLSSATQVVVNEADITKFNADIVGTASTPYVDASTCYNTASVVRLKIRNISFYPNPVYDQITINASVQFKEAELYNMNGVKVFESTVSSNTISGLSELSQGLYVGHFTDVYGQLYQSKISIHK
jgi:hypothetical protein